jgi:hypothetical protein
MKAQNTKNSIHSTSSKVMRCIFQHIWSGKTRSGYTCYTADIPPSQLK